MHKNLLFSVVFLLSVGTSFAASDPIEVVLLSGTNMSGFVSTHMMNIVRDKLVGAGAKVNVIELEGMDLSFPYGHPTKAFRQAEAKIRVADGVVVVIPEYQGSYPGILKLFLDQLSYPHSPLRDKMATFIGYSGGEAGGRVPVETLSRDFQTQGAHIFSRRTFVSHDSQALTTDGTGFVEEGLNARLESQLRGFVKFVLTLRTGMDAEPGELFSATDRLKAIAAAGVDLAALHPKLFAAGSEKEMVDVEVAFFRHHRSGMSAQDQARFWEEMSHEIDEKLHYRRTHVARGYRWTHDGQTYFVYQGPLTFRDEKHATLVIEPSGEVRMGLADNIYDISNWTVDLNQLHKL